MIVYLFRREPRRCQEVKCLQGCHQAGELASEQPQRMQELLRRYQKHDLDK